MHENKWNSQISDFALQHIIPKSFLGEEDADDEWTIDQKPIDVFLHTNSYEAFKRTDCLYLFGRRGTGKTTMMHMLRYEVRRGYIPDYSYAWILDQEEAYHELSMQLRLSPLAQLPPDELVHLLVKKWVWVLNISSMEAVVEAEYENPNTDNDISTIENYLRDQNSMGVGANSIDFHTSPFRRLSKIITEELDAVDYISTKVGSALVKISNRLYTPNYKKAQKALSNVLDRSNGTCLVMVDSIELYNLQDNIQQAVITALIEAARRMHNTRTTNRILVKAAFPSEIYPRLAPMNKGKTEKRNVFILWQYRDLVSLLAKRYWRMVHINGKPDADDYGRLNDFNTARDFLYQYLPPQVIGETNVAFDTLAYITRHTQKKPRQIILLLNVVLTLAEDEGMNLFKITPNWVVRGVHARLDMVVDSALDMYQQINPHAEQLVKRALTGAPSYFDHSTLDQLLKEVGSLRAEAGLSINEVKSLFLEIGVIGLWVDRRNLNSKKTILETLFEYQVKNTLTITNRSQCAVHPMFYQELQIDVDPDTFVYPLPAEDEEKQVLADAGIQLGGGANLRDVK